MRYNLKSVLMKVIKTRAFWQGNNYKILLLVIISTIQPQYQSTICYSIAIHLYECHLLKQVPEEAIIIFKWGERRTQFHCCTILLTPVQSFSWLIYFHENESMYFKLLDTMRSIVSIFVAILWIIYSLSCCLLGSVNFLFNHQF